LIRLIHFAEIVVYINSIKVILILDKWFSYVNSLKLIF